MTNEELARELAQCNLTAMMGSRFYFVPYSLAKEITEALKNAEERKTGKWISDNPFVEKITFDEGGRVSNSCHCSECKDWLTASDEYPCRGYYCPNCGLKMEVDE